MRDSGLDALSGEDARRRCRVPRRVCGPCSALNIQFL